MSLSNFITKLILITVLISSLLAFLFTILFQYNSFLKETENIKKDFLLQKKKEVKREIERIHSFIKYKNNSLSYIKNKDIETIQNEILDWISTVRFGKNGYIFINTVEGNSILFDGKKNVPAIKHPNKKIFDQQIQALKTKRNNFIKYTFKKLNNNKTSTKISYILLYEPWGWIIGSGFYLDEVQKEIKQKEEAFKQTILNEIKSILIVFIILVLILVIISKKIKQYINNNIKNLIEEFKRASSNNNIIESKRFSFEEFSSLASSINEILEDKHKAEKKLNIYLKILDEHVITSTTDIKGTIKSVSKAFCEISGYSKEELIGKKHNIVKHEDMSQKTYEELWNTIQSGKIWKGELKNKKKSGEVYWVEAIIQPIIENGKISGYTAIRHNITNKKRVEYLSITDELTQLYNRRYFNKIIEGELKRAKRANSFISFMMLDIDYFKRYNDNYGHQKGDDILAKIALVLKENSKRISDYVFRIGGEEFAFIFSSVDENKSFEFANNIRKDIEQLKIEHTKSPISKYVTVSVGVVCKKANDISSSSELYKLGDSALYKAKDNGRNSVIIK